MAVVASVVSVSTTATLIGRGATLNDPNPLKVRNDSGATIYFGGSGVTTATGFPLPTATADDYFLGPGDELYAIVAAGTAALSTLKGRT